jgi:hypothetical protein
MKCLIIALTAFGLALSPVARAQQASAPESIEAVVDWRNLQRALSALIQANDAKSIALVKAKQ